MVASRAGLTAAAVGLEPLEVFFAEAMRARFWPRPVTI
jgi:hypothetical protein